MGFFSRSSFTRIFLLFTVLLLALLIGLSCSSKKSIPTASADVPSDDQGDSLSAPPSFTPVKYSDCTLCKTYARKPQALCKISEPRLREISGIAVDNNGIIWVHNDSGDGPILYALNSQCELLGEVFLEGAKAIDWEDMSIGRCGQYDCFYVGDFGDNHHRRQEYLIYRAKVPSVPGKPFGTMRLSNIEQFSFTYPEGAKNAKALAVHPNGAIYIFTKDKSGKSVMYALTSPVPNHNAKLTRIGDVPTKLGAWTSVTGADIHPTGRRLLLRTYITVLEWRIDQGGNFNKILSTEKIRVPNMDEQQGEAVAYNPKTGEYIHVSEGVNPTIYIIRCKNE